MKIGIHFSKGSFSPEWIQYCIEKNIDYKLVNCYANDILSQLGDCHALMWHHHHTNPRDILFAKQLLFALENSGKKVFPNFPSNWHFDDKVGQKYLLESIDAPLVQSYVFYSYKEVFYWIKESTFPKVFKLRNGSGSASVQLVKNQKKAITLAKKAFGRGFRAYNSRNLLKFRWNKFINAREVPGGLIKGILRLFIKTPFEKINGKERGYIYFQDFIPNNEYDIRITYVNGRCFGLRRKVRSGDFRASGSGLIEYDMSKIPEKAITTAFNVSQKLKLQTAAFDFVIHNGEPLIVELSYGFGYDKDQFNHGYWDKNLKYYPGSFNPYGWMVDLMLK
jgi:glutathione synthase/RimK-type ligase-like ATP-grasp enzyme